MNEREFIQFVSAHQLRIPFFYRGNIQHYQFCFLKAGARIFRHRQVTRGSTCQSSSCETSFQEERPENQLLRGLQLLVRIVVWPLLLGPVVADPLCPGPRVGGCKPCCLCHSRHWDSFPGCLGNMVSVPLLPGLTPKWISGFPKIFCILFQ